MKDWQFFAIAGIIISHIGFVLIFYFGAPFRVRKGGSFSIGTGTTEEGITGDRVYDRWMYVGFLMATLGAAAQVYAAVLQ